MATDAKTPELRPISSSPSISPSQISCTCTPLDISSTSPSVSSDRSSRSFSDSSHPSDCSCNGGHNHARRRNGFMRPQGTEFAESARARDSVMCLGSIAALQYYFARTGLLDGKGAQMAKERKAKSSAATKEGEETGAEQDSENASEIMAPPAVSTYRYKEPVTEPLPDVALLRRQLREALDRAQKALENARRDNDAKLPEIHVAETSVEGDGQSVTHSRHELQGLHVLDNVTLAIRQARTYYITHTHPQDLYAIRPERQIRSDLYQVLDILKRMASRGFRGGMRAEEHDGITAWVQGIHELLSMEEEQEAVELERIQKSPWRDGDWTGREREREWLFLNSFDPNPSPLPPWEDTTSYPSEFLIALSKGLRLVTLHNEMVRRSKRPFGAITTFYVDLAKPYRCAENLRYWAKASELRWEIKLDFDALEVVHGDSEEAWIRFENAIRVWCAGVREELSREWADMDQMPSTARASHS
ncbi:hypothetical protein AAFC00_005350 [Neodothiora populina]|uniref:Uncharacterized protein n=1 Tax=Neodothiora populina TaxID=2781224 RepID=A0ABR3PKL2_9PEZI